MNENLLKLLLRVDTPTACNAIEVALSDKLDGFAVDPYFW